MGFKFDDSIQSHEQESRGASHRAVPYHTDFEHAALNWIVGLNWIDELNLLVSTIGVVLSIVQETYIYTYVYIHIYVLSQFHNFP